MVTNLFPGLASFEFKNVVLLVNEAVGALLPFILTKILPLPMF